MNNYALFPIKKTDVDWPLYRLVSHFMKVRYYLDIEQDNKNDTSRMFESIDQDIRQEKRKYTLYFIFPFEDATLPYSNELLEKDVVLGLREPMLNHEAVILKYFWPIHHVDGSLIPQFDEDGELEEWDENVPMEYFHYSGTGTNLVLRHTRTEMPSNLPQFAYNGDVLSESVTQLLKFLRGKGLSDLPWYSRLETVKAMLDGNANELHILHNAGLYDHQTLWELLVNCDVPPSEFEDLKGWYLTQLKRYAMFVLNSINWPSGEPTGNHDKELRTGLYEPLNNYQLADAYDELTRRTIMLQNKLKRCLTGTAKPERQRERGWLLKVFQDVL